MIVTILLAKEINATVSTGSSVAQESILSRTQSLIEAILLIREAVLLTEGISRVLQPENLLLLLLLLLLLSIAGVQLLSGELIDERIELLPSLLIACTVELTSLQ